jgi:hypothetical protein
VATPSALDLIAPTTVPRASQHNIIRQGALGLAVLLTASTASHAAVVLTEGYTSANSPNAVVQRQSNDPVPSPTQAAVADLKKASGLTWTELADLFPVSVRAVHNWVAGTQPSAQRERRLQELRSLVESLDAPPAAVASALRSSVGDQSLIGLIASGIDASVARAYLLDKVGVAPGSPLPPNPDVRRLSRRTSEVLTTDHRELLRQGRLPASVLSGEDS